MKYLVSFNGTKNFIEFVNALKKNWQIMQLGITNRKDIVQDYEYFQWLKNRANVKDIKHNDIEIISWLDSLTILKEVLIYAKSTTNLIIFQELHIPYSKKRADYVLLKDNKMLILEFSFDKNHFNKEEYSFENKLTQAIHYKELLSNILPNHIEISTFVFLIKPEESKTIINNDEKCRELASYIEFFFEHTKTDALTEFERIDNYFKNKIVNRNIKKPRNENSEFLHNFEFYKVINK